jgi:hypothetical protein
VGDCEYVVLAKSNVFRSSLSSNQVRLLKVLYKFRYGSTDLVSEFLGKDRSTIYESFCLLHKQGYIHKFYDSSYRLRQRPAIYTLAAKGIKYLRDNTDLDQTTLRNFYKNKTMRDEHIDHCLTVFAIALKLKAFIGKQFDLFTKYELNREVFINPLPELYLQAKSEQKPDYVLDIFTPGTYSWLLRKRIRQHQEAADESEYRYPNVLLMAQNESTERRLFRMTYETYDDFKFFLTQQDLLLSIQDGKAWIDMEETDDEEIVRVKL